jgi:hypothetical protein
VKRFDINSQLIIDYDILKNRESTIKHFKKICPNKSTFSEALTREFRWAFWSKSEHELIIELVDTRILLKPWSGCWEPMRAALEVTDDRTFDWYAFAKSHIDTHSFKHEAKIDVWDQLSWKWDELVDYCWYTRLPYERKHEKFNR